MTSNDAYLYDNSHALIAGITGAGDGYGGKTATANWWGDQAVEGGHFDYMLAFDPKGGNFVGENVTGPVEAAEAIQGGARRIDWSPAYGDDLEEQHDTFLRFAQGLNGDAVLIHDDAVMYASADSLKWATALGGNPGDGQNALKSLVATQDPWDLPREGVRANLPVTIWVGPINETGEHFFESNNMSSVADQIRREHTEPHMWTVRNGTETMTYDPVPAEYA